MKRTAFFLGSLLCFSFAFAQTNLTDTAELPPVEVRAVRAGNKAPFTKTNLSKASIENRNLGQDLPILLNHTPSTVISSDAGNGIGYTGLRIRGTDLTRINVTLNGIPYNDPESQSVYFVDLPDFASSVSSLQIQRGVGTSTNGAGAFGGSINLSTNEVNPLPYADLLNSYGSFNSRRHTVKAGTGLIDGRFTVDARLSAISSDGFIDRATSDLKAFYLSGAWITEKTSLRVNIFSGKERTYQAWNGIPEFKLFFNRDSLLNHYFNNIGSLYFTKEDSAELFDANPRTYNVYNYANQVDDFKQDHYQLFFNHQLRTGLQLSSAFYLTQGAGFYEQFRYNQKYASYGLPNFMSGTTEIKRTDLVRQLWLQNDLFGANLSLEYRTGRLDAILGGGWNRFNGHHFGTVTWAMQGIEKDYKWYNFPSRKDDGNVFLKAGYQLTPRLYATADLQYRTIQHQINGTRKFPDLKVDRQFRFFNPKAGISYATRHFNLYASYAVANKEPNRNDSEVGGSERPPVPEQLHDLEVGLEHKGIKSSYGVTVYYMRYFDQLVQTGKLNDVGDAIRINVPQSYRLGVELSGGYQVRPWLRVEGNLTLSENKLKDYVDYIPRYDAAFDPKGYDTLRFSGVDIAFSPAVTGFLGLHLTPIKNLQVQLSTKGVSGQYLDNTGSEQRKIRGYYTQDAQVRYLFPAPKMKQMELVLQLNNIFNRQYESNGYTYSYFVDTTLVRENFYYPMAGFNWMAGLNIRL